MKKGLDYFSFDVDFFEDEKIQYVSSRFGIKGEVCAIRLLTRLYRDGYFLRWDVQDSPYLFAKVACLPACKSLVSLIMIFRARQVETSVYRRIHEHAGELTMSYEMYMTFYEKSANIDAFAICGNTVVGYSSDPKIDVTFMERECQKILRGNSFKATVKIFTRLDPFLERLDSMNAHKESLEEGIKFRPDEKYPELSRNELIKHTILAICL